MKPKSTRGGARPGAGRPATGRNTENKQRQVRLTDPQWAKFKLLGGVRWLRSLLN